MQLLKSKKISNWLPHLVAVMFVLLLPLFVFDRSDEHLIFWRYSYYYQMFFMIVAFYVNYFILVPRLYFSKNKLYFFLVLILLALVILLLSNFFYEILAFEQLKDKLDMKDLPKPLQDMNHDDRKPFFINPRVIDNFYFLILVLSTSTGTAILKRVRQNEKIQQEKEKAHQDTELAFLKNQISPHFFFNALNNIYALIAIDSNKAQKSVEKLSGLMRYLIYESDIKTIELSKEFEFNQNYIDLMRQRLTSKVELEVNISDIVSNFNIPPLLFIPFIENAFKHGVSYREKSFIKIFLKSEKDKVIFECRNSIPKRRNGDESVKGGVGVANIKKRLDLIYGDKASLKMTDENDVFIVSLTIPLIKENV